jgi:FG-GAP-like repeat
MPSGYNRDLVDSLFFLCNENAMKRWILPACLSSVLFMIGGELVWAEKPADVQFKKRQLDAEFRSEGVAVGDFNHDGKKDVAAGFVWYEAPDWKMHAIVEKVAQYDVKNYSNSFCTFSEDLNGDGWDDIIVVDFPGTPTWWFENPKGKTDPWVKHTLTPVTNNESPQMLDIDGDGVRELIAAFSPDAADTDGPKKRMGIFKRKSDPKAEWTIHAVSAAGADGCNRYSHGLGIGDINKDGRNDVFVPQGWWTAPADSTDQEWKWNPAKFGDLGAQMYTFDFDADGDQDVLSTSPHAYGIWWYEQGADGDFIKHEIDNTISQVHSVCFADINGDELPDFVTGKRWLAHAAGDPGIDDPAVICWYELSREGGKPKWIRHQFDHDSGVGTQFELNDLNEDGLIDVISSNKKGVHIFLQSRE